MVYEFAAVLVESYSLRIPLDLQPLQVWTIDRKRFEYLVNMDSGGDLLEPAIRRAHDRYAYVVHVLDGADPELFGYFHVSAVAESFELMAVDFKKVVNLVSIKIHRVAEVESFPVSGLLVLDQRQKHLQFDKTVQEMTS